MNLHLVLVRTEYSTNIGAAARALANMGGQSLVLIAPQCEIDQAAHQAAAGAQDSLNGRRAYESWDDFYLHEGDGIRIGLTRRAGYQRKVYPLDEKIRELTSSIPQNLYLVLGPEADGLNAEDLAYMNFSCSLPTFGEFASLNLAQAALLAMYVIRNEFGNPTAPENPEPSVAPFYFPDPLIKAWLTAMGFDIRARKASAYLTLRKLFLHNRPTRHEFQVLEAVLQQNIRRLKSSVGFTSEELADNGGDVAGKNI